MSLVLKPGEQIQMQETLRTLLVPHPDPREWTQLVLALIMPLLEADKAAMTIPGTSGEYAFINHEPNVLAEYHERIEPLATQLVVWERLLQLGVFSRAAVWHPHHDVFYSSRYYNEFIVPARCHDAIGVAVRTSGPVRAESVVQLLLHHASTTGPRFTERSTDILRLMRPAIEAGVRIQLARIARMRDLDGFQDGVQLVDPRGATLYRNAALDALLKADPEREQLADSFTHIATATRVNAAEPHRWRTPAVREVRTRRGRYRVRSEFAPADLSAGAPLQMIRVERLIAARTTAHAPDFGLTPKEAEVAALITSEGLSNQEIAARLCISFHTARHHVERIREKLDVSSRAAIGPALSRRNKPL